jgi:hypothetical protein
MASTRMTPRLGSAPLEPGALARANRNGDEESLAKLTAKLAQQAVELAAVELKRIPYEMRQQRKEIVRASAALLFGSGFAAVGMASLVTGSILSLGRAWDNYGAAALATGGGLLVLTVIAFSIVVSATRRIRGKSDDDEERSPDHGS